MTDDREPMDDPIDEIDELDELLSAHLDAELELLEERPDLDDEIVDARLRELRGVADAVGASVPPLPPAVVDAQIAAALEALPQPADAPASLTAARAGRRSRRLADAFPLVASAAAILVVVFGFAVLVGSVGSDSDDDAGDSAEEAPLPAVDFRGESDGDTATDEAAAAEEEPAADAMADSGLAADEAEGGDEGGDGGGDDSAGEDAEEATDDTEAPAEAPEATEAPAEAPEATEAPATTAAAGLPIELPEICTDDLLARLAADEVMSVVEQLDGTAEVTVKQGEIDLTVVIDPGLCDGRFDPILEGAP
ncbi:MAG: hypothetical protein AAFZ07_27200 [Actinomycetota bacterium]